MAPVDSDLEQQEHSSRPAATNSRPPEPITASSRGIPYPTFKSQYTATGTVQGGPKN